MYLQRTVGDNDNVVSNNSQNLFGFDANYWSTNNVWNDVYGLKDGEAKFDAYNKLAFTQVCIGMEQGGTTRYLEITYSSTAMLDLLKDGSFKSKLYLIESCLHAKKKQMNCDTKFEKGLK